MIKIIEIHPCCCKLTDRYKVCGSGSRNVEDITSLNYSLSSPMYPYRDPHISHSSGWHQFTCGGSDLPIFAFRGVNIAWRKISFQLVM